MSDRIDLPPAPDSVAARAWAREEGGGAFRPTPVHRLDRNTSGVLLVARSGVGLRALQEAWRLGRVEKTYWAVLWTGDEKIPEGATVDFPLRKDPSTNTVTVAPDGAFSRTIFRTLIRRPPLALVALDLETGRPHQARVHAAEATLSRAEDRARDAIMRRVYKASSEPDLAAQQQQVQSGQQATFAKARAACLEGKGYTVK